MRPLFFSYLALAICFLSACETAGTPEEAFGWQTNGGAIISEAERNELSSSASASSEPFAFEGTGDSIVLEITETELPSPVSETGIAPQADTPVIPDTSNTFDAPDAIHDDKDLQQESIEDELHSAVSPSDDPSSTTDQLADVETAIDPSSVNIALLLPLQTPRPQVARIAADMRNAAEMALFNLDLEEITLIPLDTGGTVDGARKAMENAIAAEADIILGPLLADSVRASAPLAAENNLTVIAFSNDFTVLEENILLLGLSPEQDVERILSFAMEQGIRDFAAMLPDTAYGARVRTILTSYIADTGGRLHGIELYSREIEGPYEPARRLAALYRDSVPSFRALLLADSGQPLRIASSALAFNDIAPPDVQLLGTHLWDDGPGIFEEPSLRRGWFPMPHSEVLEQFEQQFEQLHGNKPESIAGLAYDAVHLVGLMVQEGGDWRAEPAPPAFLTNPAGFTGIQGLFRFLPDGRSQHSLAVWEIADEEKILLQSPKQSFSEGS